MTYTITDIIELIRHHLVLSVPEMRQPTATSGSSSPRSPLWRRRRCGGRSSGSSATAAAPALTPTSSTRTGITTPTKATSTAPTAGRYPGSRPSRQATCAAPTINDAESGLGALSRPLSHPGCMTVSDMRRLE